MLDSSEFVLNALVEEALVTPEQVDVARKAVIERARVDAAGHEGGDAHATGSERVLDTLIEQGIVAERTVSLVRAGISECVYIDVDHYDINIAHARLMPRDVAAESCAFVLFSLDGMLTVGMRDPLDLRAVDRLRGVLHAEIVPVLGDPSKLRGLIERAYSLSTDHGIEESKLAGIDHAHMDGDEEPIVAAVNQIIQLAIEHGASDIHIGPDEKELHLRYRVDGVLRKQRGPGMNAHSGIVQRIKVMAGLDLTQTRRPQDGKFRFSGRSSGSPVDVRVSIIPTVWGENVVIRLLASGASLAGFNELGFDQSLDKRFREVICQPHGMVLVSGPTGSGKTTTLYTALNQINAVERNVVTIEDPVEIRLPLIRQIQVNTEIGMTFAGALRSVLRHDPDVVLVGEIRDEETARIATQAALTGHLVFSTLHTNDAAGAVARLIDLGCPPFAINASLVAVLAQRLCRKVCEHCAQPTDVEPTLLKYFGLSEADAGLLMAGTGCARCAMSGFRGRIGLYELLTMSRSIRDLIASDSTGDALSRAAIETGMQPMWQDGVRKAQLGWTTLEEVARATVVDHELSGGSPMRLSA